MRTLPALGTRNARALLSSVVLPAPLGPISATNSPFATLNVIWSSNVRPPSRTLRSTNSSSLICSGRRFWAVEEPRELAFEGLFEREYARTIAERSAFFEHREAPLLARRERLQSLVIMQDLRVVRAIRRGRDQHHDGVRIQAQELLDRQPRHAADVAVDRI